MCLLAPARPFQRRQCECSHQHARGHHRQPAGRVAGQCPRAGIRRRSAEADRFPGAGAGNRRAAARAGPDGARLEHHRHSSRRAARRTGHRFPLRLVTRRAGRDRRCAGGCGDAGGGPCARLGGPAALDAAGAHHRRRGGRTHGRGGARHRSRGDQPAEGLYQPRIDWIVGHVDPVRDRARQRLAGGAVGAAGAASAWRLVRDRGLHAPAERHRFLDPQDARRSRPELRGGRRQLRVPHGARYTRAALA